MYTRTHAHVSTHAPVLGPLDGSFTMFYLCIKTQAVLVSLEVGLMIKAVHIISCISSQETFSKPSRAVRLADSHLL